MGEFFRPLPDEDAAIGYASAQRSSPASAVVEAARRGETELLAIEGVEGVGTSDGCILVYARDAAVGRRLPQRIGGVPVRVRVTGEIATYGDEWIRCSSVPSRRAAGFDASERSRSAAPRPPPPPRGRAARS